MDHRTEGAGTAEFLNPDLGLRDIESVVGFRITHHHGMEELFGLLLPSGAQTGPRSLQGARGGEGLGIDGRTHRLPCHKSIKRHGKIGSRNDMGICGLLELLCRRQDRLDIAAGLAMSIQLPHRHHGDGAWSGRTIGRLNQLAAGQQDSEK